MSSEPLFCDRCTRQVTPGEGDFYVVRIEAVADPTPPTLAEDARRRDLGKEIEHLIDQMRDLSQQELLDQVYRRVTIFLCVPCYQQWIENPTGTS